MSAIDKELEKTPRCHTCSVLPRFLLIQLIHAFAHGLHPTSHNQHPAALRIKSCNAASKEPQNSPETLMGDS